MDEFTANTTNEKSANLVLKRLRSALQTDGDFPVRARVVSELRSLANNPNTSIGKITDIILREPSLGTRVLHIVNSAFYQRSVPIMTISQAVIHIGMRTLSDLCTGLILIQKFVPAARRGGTFAGCLKANVLTSILASRFAAESDDKTVMERSYLAGTFYTLGYLLLAFYFPQILENAHKRSKERHHDIRQSITEILGISPLELNMAILEDLEIPQYYRDIITEALSPLNLFEARGPNSELVDIIFSAGEIAHAIAMSDDGQGLDLVLRKLLREKRIPLERLYTVMKELPESFAQYCKLVDLDFLSLPEYIYSFTQLSDNRFRNLYSPTDLPNYLDIISADILQNIEAAIANNNSVSHAISLIMKVMTKELAFDRVLFLEADSDRKHLRVNSFFGPVGDVDPKEVEVSLSSNFQKSRPEVRAFYEKTPQTFGTALFKDGWPFVALPVGYSTETIGVLYADCLRDDRRDKKQITPELQSAITSLIVLLDKAVQQISKTS